MESREKIEARIAELENFIAEVIPILSEVKRYVQLVNINKAIERAKEILNKY